MPHHSVQNDMWQEFISKIGNTISFCPIFCIKRVDQLIFHNPSVIQKIQSYRGELLFSSPEEEICGLDRFLKGDYSIFVHLDTTLPQYSKTLSINPLEKIFLVDKMMSYSIDPIFTVISQAASQHLRNQNCEILTNNSLTLEEIKYCLEKQRRVSNPFKDRSYDIEEHQDCQNSTLHVSNSRFIMDLRDSFHESGPCQLWWPLNHSEVFIHSNIDAALSPLRMKQKFIIACSNHDESHFQEYQVVIEDLWSSQSCSECISFRSIGLPAYDVPQIFESIMEYHHNEEPNGFIHSTKHLAIRISRSDNKKQISTFELVLKIKYGSQYWTDHSAFALTGCPIHPMASQLETRDDIGFALNALLPNASSFLEVGVQHGNFAQIILNTWKNLRTYVAVDPWKTWPAKVYYDIANNVQAIQDHIHLQFLFDIQKYGSKVFVLRMESLEAAAVVADESVDVVYLDAMHHYYAVKLDIEAWWPKVKPGGLLSGHDYILDVMHSTIFSAKPAVDEFARRHGLMVLSTNDEARPAYPSWFLFKPCRNKP
jgi:hypothetical protein